MARILDQAEELTPECTDFTEIYDVSADATQKVLYMRLPKYTVATLPTTGVPAGALAYCTDLAGSQNVVFYDSANWRRVADRQVASTTITPHKLPNYAFASLPTGSTGNTVYCTDCLKAAETTGNGTGNIVYYDGANWIRSDTGANAGS